MTHSTPGRFAVSNLRHHQRQRTLAVMLALAGTVACGRESMTGLHSPDLAAPPANQLTVPTTASLITQWQADATRAEIENSRRGVNSLNYETYAGLADIVSRDQWFAAPVDAAPLPSDPPPPPSDCTMLLGCVAYSVQMSGYVPPARIVGKATDRQSKSRPARGTKPSFFYVYDGYDNDPCKFYRDEIRRLRSDYDRAYAEFWENLTVNFWRFPLNWATGGPVDIMRSKFQQMYFVALASRSYNCVRPPRTTYTIP